MKVAVVGSRAYPELGKVVEFIDSLPRTDIVVSGGATGVDREAAWAATRRGMVTIIFEAEWDLYGKSAGFKCNVKIVHEAERLVAFWNGFSHGTQHSIRLARQKGIPTIVLTPQRSYSTPMGERYARSFALQSRPLSDPR